jgi:hypothetical protein
MKAGNEVSLVLTKVQPVNHVNFRWNRVTRIHQGVSPLLSNQAV